MANLGYVQVTRECNQRCLFCSNPPIQRAQTLETVCAQIDDLVARGYHGVILTGGEPTLSPFLSQALGYARKKGLPPRIITNGQRLEDRDFLEDLWEAGLRHVHVSLHSNREEVQDFLTQNEGSLRRITAALENISALGLNADINTVICRPNAHLLHETVAWVMERFPGIRHFVFNNIDPQMNRCAENPEVIPRLSEFELSLHRALVALEQDGRSFRVERVPLCYMAEFAASSTETRKIVKGEERVVHFLDGHKGTVRQTSWVHGKAACCRDCLLDDVCAGLYAMDNPFLSKELYPLFLDPGPIRREVLDED